MQERKAIMLQNDIHEQEHPDIIVLIDFALNALDNEAMYEIVCHLQGTSPFFYDECSRCRMIVDNLNKLKKR